MDYLAELEVFFEDIKHGFKEIEALEVLGDKVALENGRRWLMLGASTSSRLIEKLLEPNFRKLLGCKITTLPIPTRTINALHAANVITIAELLRLSVNEVLTIPGIGARGYYLTHSVLIDYGLNWELLKRPKLHY